LAIMGLIESTIVPERIKREAEEHIIWFD
jgi:hypothetical protein